VSHKLLLRLELYPRVVCPIFSQLLRATSKIPFRRWRANTLSTHPTCLCPCLSVVCTGSGFFYFQEPRVKKELSVLIWEEIIGWLKKIYTYFNHHLLWRETKFVYFWIKLHIFNCTFILLIIIGFFFFYEKIKGCLILWC